MVNGVLDIGNTTAKWAIFREDDLVDKGIISENNWEDVSRKHKEWNVEAWIVSSVSEVPDHRQLGFEFMLLETETPLPVTNLYKTPSTLGKDRIAGVCGAQTLFPKQACLVIDAGTCITYDLLDAEGNYHGGNICPGIHMRLKAMHAFTGRLPQLDWQDDLDFMGVDTKSSMISGVAQGIIGEAEHLYQQYSQRFGALQVIVCGGDRSFFEKNLKMGIFAAPELVPVGLNSILRHKQSLHG